LVQINVGMFFGNDTSRYTSIAYYKYFEQQSMTAVGIVEIKLLSIKVGADYQ
jgi:hypothetical protein